MEVNNSNYVPRVVIPERIRSAVALLASANRLMLENPGCISDADSHSFQDCCMQLETVATVIAWGSSIPPRDP